MLTNLRRNWMCPWFQLQMKGNRKEFVFAASKILWCIKGESFWPVWNNNEGTLASCLVTWRMWFLTVLFSRYISYKCPSPFSHFLLRQIMVLLLYDERRRLELVANEKTCPLRNVWLHCTGWDWTCLLNHLSVHLLLSANWVDAGAQWNPAVSQQSKG